MRKSIVIICLGLLLSGSITYSAHAYTVEMGIFFNGIDLDLGVEEYDRTLLLVLMGDTIEELLRPQREPLADFSPSVDVSFGFDPANDQYIDLILQENVQIAVLDEMSFDDLNPADSGFLKDLEFSNQPFAFTIDRDELVVAWTPEDHYFAIGNVRITENWSVIYEVAEVVPEPSTVMLLGLGLLGLIGFAKRKKHLVAMLAIVVLASSYFAAPVSAQASDEITIRKEGSGNGSILIGEHTCDSSCVEMTVPYVDRRALALKVAPDADSFFVRWENASGNALDETFSVEPGDTIIAVFDRKFGETAVFDYDFWRETFNLPTGRLQSVPVERTFSTDDIIAPFSDGEIVYGVALDAEIQLQHEASLIRVVLEDEEGQEYLLYEAYPLLVPSLSFSIKKAFDETWLVDAITPRSVKIQTIDATITIHDLLIDTIPKTTNGPLPASAAQQINDAQELVKIENLNRQIEQKDLLWRAGETPISQLSYAEKNALFEGDQLPNLQGFEYYKGGFFKLAASVGSGISQPAPPGPNEPVETFDWRNRHGENWMSPVTNQRHCGSCWAFGATGATEAAVNLYFNQHLDLDLAEQDALSCASAGSCRGGNYVRTLNYYRTNGVVDEACFPYTAIDARGCNFGNCNLTPSPCSDKCTNPAELIRISGTVALGSSNYPRSEDSLKKMVINYGPVSAGISSWWHVMTLAGYGTIHEGEVIYNGGAHDPAITIPANHSSIGETYWIFKNSWGTGWGDRGYGNVSVDIGDISAHAVQTPIISATPRQTRCVDNDGDDYYNWGISSTRPSSCPSIAKPQRDCNDADSTVGPYGSGGQCLPVPINLTDLSPQARWASGVLGEDGHSMLNYQRLPWMGAENDNRGFVRLTHSTLEDRSYQLVLRMHPMWRSNGTIKGWHPWRQLPSTQSITFRSQIGFLRGARYTGGATFMVWEHHRENGREVWNLVASVQKGYTGRLDTITADLSHLAGENVSIELRVDAGRSAGQDWAAWINPQIIFTE